MTFSLGGTRCTRILAPAAYGHEVSVVMVDVLDRTKHHLGGKRLRL
jgi:hypothetical protein